MSWIRTTTTEQFPPREGRVVRAGKRDIAVFNLVDGFAAIENKCPHSGGPLCDGIVSGRTVVCPLHGWKISLDSGEVLRGDANALPVDVFETSVSQNVLLLNTEPLSQEELNDERKVA